MSSSGSSNNKMQWTVRRLSSFSEVSAIVDEINAGGASSPILSSRFLAPIMDKLAPNEDLYVATFCSTRPHILTILTRRCDRIGAWMTYQPPQAPLGLFWVERGFDWRGVIPSLFRLLPQIATHFSIMHQETNDLPGEIGPAGDIVPHITTGAITINGDFEAYWEQRPAKYRRNINNKYNRLRRDGLETRLESLRETSQMADAVADFGLMESAGWKGRENTAVHPDNAQGEIYRNIMQSFSSHGEAIAFRYFIGTDLACTDLALLSNKQLIFLKTTYSEDFSAYSPSQLMRKEIFEYVFDNQLADRIEFYGRVQDRHRAVCTDFHDICHVNLHRWVIQKKIFKLFHARGAERTADASKN